MRAVTAPLASSYGGVLHTHHALDSIAADDLIPTRWRRTRTYLERLISRVLARNTLTSWEAATTLILHAKIWYQHASHPMHVSNASLPLLYRHRVFTVPVIFDLVVVFEVVRMPVKATQSHAECRVPH